MAAASEVAVGSPAVDWHGWHDDYDRPGSPLELRLRAVRARVREALDGSPPGPLRAISLCAGQGRDLPGVLADHFGAHVFRGEPRSLVPGVRLFGFVGYDALGGAGGH